MKIIKSETFASAYKILLQTLLNEPECISAPRQQNIHELLNGCLVIENPKECLYLNKRRSSQQRYICGELLWYLTGDNSASFISEFSKFWNTIKNTDDTLNSAYGYLIFKERYNPSTPTQWEWVYDALKTDKDTRQAILHFNKPHHQWAGNKDFVCTMYGIFNIRDNKLNFTIHMRSNDSILGLPTDIPFFVILQLNMLTLLQKTYPELTLGTYTHIANSLHLYEKHFPLVTEMLNSDFDSFEIPQGAENLIDDKGKTSGFIRRTKNSVMVSGPSHDPKSPFEFWMNDNIFGMINCLYHTKL